jgi:hypothetical protein
MDTDDLPESVDINFLTSIKPEHLDGHVPGLEHIFDSQRGVFTAVGDGKLPSCYLSRSKGKAKAVQLETTSSDDDESLNIDFMEDENDVGNGNADVETSSNGSQATV